MRFDTTHWSMVLGARSEPTTESREALSVLCETYWRPIYSFIRGQSYSPEDASDLTQAYFARLLERRTLEAVHPSKGRFRSFLLVSVRHFLSDERDRDRALKRGGGKTILSLDSESAENDHREAAVEFLTPEAQFERKWAQTVLDRAMDRLRENLVAAGKGASAEHLMGMLTADGERASYREVGETLGMSEGAVKVAVSRLRRRFGKVLREVVAETVARSDQVDSELQHLLKVLQGQAAH